MRALIMNSLGGGKGAEVEGRSCANRERNGVESESENKVGLMRALCSEASQTIAGPATPNPRPGQLNFIVNDK